MEKKPFFKTKEGELCIAGLVTLCSFPVTIAAIAAEFTPLYYLSAVMIVGGMMFSPLRAFVFKRKD